MAERVDKPEVVHRVARRLDRGSETVAEIVDGFLEEIHAALKKYQGESRMLDSPEDVCAGQAGFEYPATSVLFSNTRRQGASARLWLLLRPGGAGQLGVQVQPVVAPARCLAGRRPTAGRCELHGFWGYWVSHG
jgi:hypothetical protein